MDIEYFKAIYRKYCNTLSVQDRKEAMKMIKEYQQIRLNVDNIDNVIEVQDKIKELGFQSESQMQFLQPLQEASKTLQMVLGSLGFIAMIVSAISIANTMVMSIYERTKEIGIMKVLGCIIKDIRKLFLFEAAIIGLFGGIMGIILGYLSSWLINKFGQPIFGALMSGNYMYDMTNTKFSIIPLYLPFAALGISIAVGLVSGYFPARRATKISAIEAMKTDG
jgi:ABC-type antimicrobial peptide transport system permease subunit